MTEQANRQGPTTAFADRLRQHCLQKGWDWGRLAREAGVSRTTLHHLLKGTTRWPHASTVRKIASALGCPPEELWQAVWQQPSLTAGSTAEDRRDFDRATNYRVEEVYREHPELFRSWGQSEWDELYSSFGTGGPLTAAGVKQAAEHVNRKRRTLQHLHVILETHLEEVARNLVETLYQMVCSGSNLEATEELAALLQEHRRNTDRPNRDEE